MTSIEDINYIKERSRSSRDTKLLILGVGRK